MTNYFEQIDAYKEGLLTGETLKAFEDELANNAELQEAVENHDVVGELLDLMWEDDVRREMGRDIEAIHNLDSHIAKKSVKIIPLRYLTSVAAAMVVMLAALFVFKGYLSGMPEEEIYTKHLKKPMTTLQTRGENKESTNIADCDLGHEYLYGGQMEEAKKIFLSVLDDPEATLRCQQKSEYYLMLYYLKQKEVAKRNALLSKITNNSEHVFREDALKLQAVLK